MGKKEGYEGYVVVPTEVVDLKPVSMSSVPSGVDVLGYLRATDYDLKPCALMNEAWAVYKLNWLRITAMLFAACIVSMLPLIGPLYFFMYVGVLMMILNAMRESNTTEGRVVMSDALRPYYMFFPVLGQGIALCFLYGSYMVAWMVSDYVVFLNWGPEAANVFFLLLLLPLIYLSVHLAFATPVLLEFHTENVGVFRAMRISAVMVHKHFWKVLGMQILIGLLMASGFLFFYVGALVTVPYAIVVDMAMFKEIFGLLNTEFRPNSCVVCV